MTIIGGGIFEVLEISKGTNSCDLTISGREWPTAYRATIQKMGVFQWWIRANSPINACKIKIFIGHKLGALFVQM